MKTYLVGLLIVAFVLLAGCTDFSEDLTKTKEKTKILKNQTETNPSNNNPHENTTNTTGQKKELTNCPNITIPRNTTFPFRSWAVVNNTQFLNLPSAFVNDLTFTDGWQLVNKAPLPRNSSDIGQSGGSIRAVTNAVSEVTRNWAGGSGSVISSEPSYLVYAYDRESFSCRRGIEQGENVNKLYCMTFYDTKYGIYEPRLKRTTLDLQGNILKVEEVYIKKFVFDLAGKDTQNEAELSNLTLETIVCSKSGGVSN